MKFLSSLIVAALVALLSQVAIAQQTQAVGPYKDFKGTINLDVRDSKADWVRSRRKRRPRAHPTSSSCCTTTPA